MIPTDTFDKDRVARKINQVITDKCITKAEFLALAPVNGMQVEHYYSGRLSCFSLEQLEKIYKAII